MKSSNSKSRLWDTLILIFFIVGVTYVIMFLLEERAPDFSIPSEDFYPFVSANQPVIIDLRESEEVEKQPLHYTSMLYVPFLDIEKDISQLSDAVEVDPAKTYLLICSDGNRSRLISFYLASHEIAAYYLKDGLWGVPAEQFDRLLEMAE